MRRIPIRMKLATALAVPLVALIALTATEVSNASGEAADARQQRSLALAAVDGTGVIDALQVERSWALVELVGADGDVAMPIAGYEETRSNTDDALARLRNRLEDAGDAATSTYNAALGRIGELEQIRADIAGNETPRSLDNLAVANEIYDRYDALVVGMLRANTRLAFQVDDTQLRRGAELLEVTSQQVEDLSDLVRSALTATVSNGASDQGGGPIELVMARGSFNRGTDALQAAGAPYDAVVAEHFPRALADDLHAQLEQAVGQGSADVGSLLTLLGAEGDANYAGLQAGIAEAIGDQADELQGAASSRDRWLLALVAVTLATTATLAWLVSRSITLPLRALTRQAKEMAERHLPNAVSNILETPLGENVAVPQTEPVTVETSDEVADVADALNTVQVTALDLAVEQAVLRRNIADSFVNLGRRNQNLLGRQLDFITELESHETDPETLASLFRLDHLATRMRRNAESLLVLAGIEPPRKWAAPVRITDIIRAALGEVEDYQRVTVGGVEAATIVGSAAADIAHLIAEFVENALTFSPPDQQVDIRGRHNAGGTGYTLAIIDAGFGMAEADLAEANRRLNGAESFTVAPSKYLGHYVAGNLAVRHGIHLRLDGSPGNGVAATVELPPSLLTTEEPADEPITDPHGTRRVPADVPLAPDPESSSTTERVQAPTEQPPERPQPATASLPAAASPAPARAATSPERRGPAPRPTDAGAAHAPRTPGGLVKRTPGGAAATPSGPRPQDDALAGLANLKLPGTRHVTAPEPAAPAAPVGPPSEPTPSAAATPPTETTSSGLARRTPGRHLPDTEPISVPRHAPQASNAGAEPAPDPHDPGDVYGFLTSFTAGVQRGLDVSRPRDER